MTAHTPGPWEIEHGHHECVNTSTLPWAMTGPGGREVCQSPNGVDVDDEDDANACLIAAAPDLLAACEAMLEWVARETDDRDWPHPVLDQARAAIAKARGEQP